MVRAFTIKYPPYIALENLPLDTQVLTIMGPELSSGEIDKMRAMLANTSTRFITLLADVETADQIVACFGDDDWNDDTL